MYVCVCVCVCVCSLMPVSGCACVFQSTEHAAYHGPLLSQRQDVRKHFCTLDKAGRQDGK